MLHIIYITHAFVYKYHLGAAKYLQGKCMLSSNSLFFSNSLLSGILPPSTHSHFQSLNFNHSLSNSSTKMKTPDCCFPLDLYSLYSLYFLSTVSSLPWLLSPIKRVLFLGGAGEIGVNFHWLFLRERVIVSAALSRSKARVCHSLFLCHPNFPLMPRIVCGTYTSSIHISLMKQHINPVNDATP